MSEPKNVLPLLEGFSIGSPISDRDGVVCCPAVKEHSENKYIVKTVSVPGSQTQLDALLFTGAYETPAQALEYFKATVEDLQAQAQLLQRLSRLEGYLPYDGWQAVEMDGGRTGYELYLLSTYKRSLEKFMERNPMTHRSAVSLGLDICTALAIARRAGYIYADLKPSNIFLSENREFRIGDLGFLALDSLKYAALPGMYRSAYTAPELLDAMSTVNTTADTYALGMILYQIYNNGTLPQPSAEGEAFPFPVNADYEMAEIITRALASDPAERYADPTEMGQALAAYMQRNPPLDEPITPPQAEPLQTDGAPILETILEDFDDSAPGEADAEALTAEHITEETGSMLSQADLLISDIPLEEPDEAPLPSQDLPEEPQTDVPQTADEIPAIHIPELTVEQPAESDSEDLEKLLEDAFSVPDRQDAPADPVPAITAVSEKPRRKGLAIFAAMLLLAALAFGGYYYYDNYYLQTVTSIQVEGQGNSMTVILDTQTDNSLLTVCITDTYGNTQRSAVTGNRAAFTELLPGTLYKVRVEIGGFHDLHPKGVSSHSYTTDAQTRILSFTAKTGSEDGSAILNFAVEGPSPESWTVSYTDPSGEIFTQEFTGHMTTLTGLTVGHTYTFRLAPVGDLILLGESSLEHTASALVTAQELLVTEHSGDSFTVTWQTPPETLIGSWTVRCYAESGYDQTLTTEDLRATFQQIDPSKAYTVEVLAAGMTAPARLSISANPYNVSNVRVEDSDPSRLVITWDSQERIPERGWLLKYMVDNSTTQGIVQCSGNSAVVQPRIPGATYSFQVISADGNSVFGGEYSYDCPNAEIFCAEDFLITQEDITEYLSVRLLVHPGYEGWTNSSVNKSMYTSTFTPGQKACMLLHLNTNFLIRALDVDVLFVIRDSQGNVLTDHVSQITTTWSRLWYPDDYQYCELDIPSIPSEPGEYSVFIYFNNAAVTTVDFTVAE